MAGNVVSNVKKYYGGQVPVPGQGDSDGKVKMLVEKTATIEIGGVQTEVELLYDADDLTTPVTPQQLGQWTDENYLIAFKKREDDGRVRGFVLYALSTESTSTDTLVNRAEFISFKEVMAHEPGASAYEFTMVEDSSTLARYLRDENGEMVVSFNLATVEAGAQSGTLDELIQSDTTAIDFEVVHEDGKSYLRLNTEGLSGIFDDMDADIEYIIGALDELPSDEHGYFNSSLHTTPGDGTTENIVIDDFRISQGGDVHGESIEFVPTHQEGEVDFGEVYLDPGTYIFTCQYTLQWVGNPRGTFLPLVTNVGDRPFDFSYEHEDVVRTTRIVTRTTRGKFSLGFPIDADTPQMGIWVKNLEIAQIASYNHAAVAHDTTLTGTGKLDSPLGVTPAAFGKVKDIPTSISQFRTGDVIPVDGPNGPAKMGKDDLLTGTAQNALAGNVAPAFVPNSTATVAGFSYMYNGSLYIAKEAYQGSWDASKFERVDLSAASFFRVFSNKEYLVAFVDINDVFLFGIKKDGTVDWQLGIPDVIKKFIEEVLGPVISSVSDLDSAVDEKVDKETGKSLINDTLANGVSSVYSNEYLFLITDSTDTLLLGIRKDGSYDSDGLVNFIKGVIEYNFKVAPKEYVDSKITEEKERAEGVENSLQTQINNIEPVTVVGGSNTPDEVFLTTVNDAITLKNITRGLYGKGIVYIRPSDNLSQKIATENTIYVFSHAVEIGESPLEIPAGCVLVFNGGSVYGGTIVGNNTRVVYNNPVFGADVTIGGTWDIPYIRSDILYDTSSENSLKMLNILQSTTNYNVVHVLPGEYSFNPTVDGDALLKPQSNTKLIIDGKISVVANAYEAYRVIEVKDVDNVEICGGELIGDADTHHYEELPDSTHEWCLGIYTHWSNGIIENNHGHYTIHDMIIHDFPGDGVDLFGNDIVVRNLKIYHCGRQGISVEDVYRATIENCDIYDIYRTAPKAAIDVEPWLNEPRDIVVRNITMKQCYGFCAVKAKNVLFENIYGENLVTLLSAYSNCERVSVKNLIYKGNTAPAIAVHSSCDVSLERSHVDLPSGQTLDLSNVYLCFGCDFGEATITGTLKKGSIKYDYTNNRYQQYNGSSWSNF